MRIPLFLLSLLFIFGVNLRVFPQTPPSDTISIDSITSQLFGEIVNLYETHNYEELFEASQKLLQRTYKEGSPLQIAEAHDNLAYWHLKKEMPARNDSMIYHDLKALEQLLKTDELARIAKTYRNLASSYMAENPQIAQEYTMKSLEVSEKMGDKAGIANSYYSLAGLNRSLEEYELSVSNSEKALELLLELQDTTDLAMAYFHSVQPHIQLGNLEKALEHGEKSVALMEAYSEEIPTMLMRAYSWRAEALRANGQYDRALEDALLGWEICKTQVEDVRDADGFKESIADVLYAQNKYEEALPYYEDFIAHAHRRDGIDKRFVEIYSHVSTCYENLGDYQNALSFAHESRTLNDSLAGKRYASLKAELQIKYDTEKKEQIIEQQSRERVYGILVIGILAGLILLSVWAYRRQNRLNTQLQKTNATNELLLKEIHHRVKNNLQTISSLLSLQSSHIEDTQIQEAVKNSQSRVGSMALIHQKLYQGENLAAIEIKEYLQVLSETIIDTFNIDTQQIEIDYQVEEVEMDVDTAIPLGLIANELLTNSLKYAFPDNRSGKIQISLEKQEGKVINFKVSDNGVGLDPQENRSGFGSQLVKLLVRQMQAKMDISSEAGISTEIQFKVA
ncbi:MAG: sensor histidine kinase [Bacteroidia bacterium]|nr:sensor histidine kinase [Bacteroidia bacterium]